MGSSSSKPPSPTSRATATSRSIPPSSSADSLVGVQRPAHTTSPDVALKYLTSEYDMDELVSREQRTWTGESRESVRESEEGSGKSDEELFPGSNRGSFALVRAKEVPQPLSPGAGKALGFDSATPEGFWTLPRGGYLVQTASAGSIQFGIPPETIKDTLAKGMSVPETYCILSEMFDRKLGLSKAEFEFPIYYRYFVCRSKAVIVTTGAFEERIRVALRETLLGPGTDCNVAEDYPAGTPADALPNFEAEGESLDPDRLKTTIDDVVTFVRYDPVEGASLAGGRVTIRPKKVPDVAKGGTKLVYEVTDLGVLVAVVPVAIKLKTSTLGGAAAQASSGAGPGRGSNLDKKELRKQYEDEEGRRVMPKKGVSNVLALPAPDPAGDPGVAPASLSSPPDAAARKRPSGLPQSKPSGSVVSMPLPSESGNSSASSSKPPSAAQPQPQPLPQFAPFDIPVFGVTMMGASHGFDSAGRTTGFVLWMNRRGIMIDPPPDSSGILEVMGVPPRAVEAVMLTHTHADHDAGTFQKILRTRQIKLYATRTVERSFIRKYAAITGFPEAFLRSMFVFVPIQCGKDAALHVYGGELRFFYSLHTIPCVGFEAYYNGQSLVYSADTRFDPDMVLRLGRAGKIGAARARQLAEFDFNHTVVLHELGVPPIHTPKESLLRAANDPAHMRKGRLLRDRLFVVHSGKTDKSEFPNQCMDWDTIRIQVEQGHSNRREEILSLLSNVPWLAAMGPDAALEKLAKTCTVREFDTKDLVFEFKRGVPPDSLFIVMAGVAREERRARTLKPQQQQLQAAMSRRTSTFESMADETLKATFFPVGGSFGEEGLLHALDKLDALPVLKIPGVQLMSLPSMAGTTRAVMELNIFKSPAGAPQNGGGAGDLPAFEARRVVAQSKLFVVEVKNKHVLKLLNGTARHQVHEELKRFAGFPEDDRWRCITRNAPLMKLLDQQLAVIDFLGAMSEEAVTVPEGHVLQDGRSSDPVAYGYIVRQGVLRVTPMNAAFSYRGFENVLQDDPYEVGRGTFVCDINALLKNVKSPYRITAVEDSQVFVLPREGLLKVLETFPGLKFQFLDRSHVGWSLEVLPPRMQMDLFGGVTVNSQGVF